MDIGCMDKGATFGPLSFLSQRGMQRGVENRPIFRWRRFSTCEGDRLKTCPTRSLTEQFIREVPDVFSRKAAQWRKNQRTRKPTTRMPATMSSRTRSRRWYSISVRTEKSGAEYDDPMDRSAPA